MKYEILQIAEIIPYKNKLEKKKIIQEYYKNSIVKDCGGYIYVEHIEAA